MMQVIRCEHPKGRRAYYGLPCIDGPDGLPAAAIWRELPSPLGDGGYSMREDEVCAAPPEKLGAWFPAWARPLLREQGFRFVTLDVPEEAMAHCGAYQVVIKRELCAERGEYLQ